MNKNKYNEMHDYIIYEKLTPNEAYYVVKMEGYPDKVRRNNEVDYVYLVMKFIHSMYEQGRLDELSETFLERCYDYSTSYDKRLIDICYFPENIKNYVFEYLEIFYEFFVNESFNYGDHKFEEIKNYLINDKEKEYFLNKILVAVDLNLFTENKEEFSSLLKEFDYEDFMNFLIENEINIYELNKEEFNTQLEYVRNKYLVKNKTLKKD